MLENDPPKANVHAWLLATFSVFLARSTPEAPRPPKIMKKSVFFRRLSAFFPKIFCQVLQIRRLCRYAGFADMHVLQIRRFCLSRVPAFVPASASAVIADADCIGVRR